MKQTKFTSWVKELECHVFYCRNSKQANSLVETKKELE